MLWDELATIDDLVLTCAADAAIFSAHKEKQKMVQFVIGLHVRYDVVRTNLLMRQPLPTLTTTYYVLF